VVEVCGATMRRAELVEAKLIAVIDKADAIQKAEIQQEKLY